jgi:hypothetical protein
MDDRGGAVFLWNQADGPLLTLWSCRYLAGLGWTAPEPVELDANNTGLHKVLAVGSAGDAVAVWTRSGAQLEVWGARLDPRTGWGEPQLVAQGLVGTYAAAVGPAGDAITLVTLSDGVRFALFESWSTPLTRQWSPLAPVEEGSGSVNVPRIAIDPKSGSAVSVWDWSEGPVGGVAAAQRTGPGGWSKAVELVGPAAGNGANPRLALGPDGSALALWEAYAGAPGAAGVWGNRLTAAGNWSPPAFVFPEDDGYGASAIGGSLRPDGTGMTVVLDRDANGSTLRSVDLDPAGNWTLAQEIQFIPDDLLAFAGTGGDGAGNVLTLWLEDAGGTGRLSASHRLSVDATAPTITVVSPLPTDTVDDSACWIRVATEAGATVYVNGLRATDEGNGTYAVLVPVQEGNFTFHLTVTDAAGNTASARVDLAVGSVVRDLAEALAAEAARTNAALEEAYNASFVASAAAAGLNATNDELVNVSHELGHLLSDYSAASAALSNVSSSLNETRASLDAATQDVAALQAAQAAATAQATASQAQSVSASAQAGLASTLALLGLLIGGGGAAYGLTMGRTVSRLEDCCDQWKRAHGGGPPGGDAPKPGGKPPSPGGDTSRPGGDRPAEGPHTGGQPQQPGRDPRDGHAGGRPQPGQPGRTAEGPGVGPAPVAGGKAGGPVSGAGLGGATGGGAGAGPVAGGAVAGGTPPSPAPPPGAPPGGVGSEVAKGAADAVGKAAGGAPPSAGEGVREGVREGVEAAKKGRPRS